LLECLINGFTTIREYFIFNNDKKLNFNIYPMNESSQFYGVLRVIVQNTYSARVQNAIIQLLEFDYDNNSFIPVYEIWTNSNGEAYLPVELTKKRYIIRIEYNNRIWDSSNTGEVFDINGDTRTYVIDDSLFSNNELNVINNIIFNYKVNNTLLSENKSLIFVKYFDKSNLISKVCLYAWKESNGFKELITNYTKCLNGASDLGYSNLLNMNLSENNYEIKVIAYKNNESIVLKTFSYNGANSYTGIFKSFGLQDFFIIFGYAVVLSLMFITKLAPFGVIFLIVYILTISYLFPSLINASITAFMLLITFIMMYILGRRE